MKFRASLQAIQTGFQKVLPALPRKSTLPVLEHLHFSLKGNDLNIIATDQEITIQTKVAVEGELEGEILVPGRRIIEIIKALGSTGMLHFSSDDDNFEITLKTQNPIGSYSMMGLSHVEYLRIPELIESGKNKTEKVVIPFKKDEIVRLATKTSYAVSTDEFRPAMNGVLFQFRSKFVNAVSTDSFRLSKVCLTQVSDVYPNELDVIIPARAIDVLKKVDGDINMSFVENKGKKTHARFDFNDSIFITRLINENFPPYESVIPETFNFKIKLNQSDFLSAVNRVSILTSEIVSQVKLHIENNTMTIFGSDEETGAHGIETLNCEYIGEHYETAFNSRYLKDALEHLGGETEENIIELRFYEVGRPVIIKPNVENDDLIALIMPVRVK
ncbi:DNA polymerase III subunit beta [Bacteroidetes/Chlorobi group bacterium ChocPot_Mid]|nr:MAG: DNA polymerase III subunit beta [Bacteroidetes/Chlorobi group bacterium ChocPot_Mid]